jgi:hypothetical protein
MMLLDVKRAAITIELSIPDCLILFSACCNALARDADLPFEQTQALATGLFSQAFAAFLRDNCGDPPTLDAMWAMWAPLNHTEIAPHQIAMPDLQRRAQGAVE